MILAYFRAAENLLPGYNQVMKILQKEYFQLQLQRPLT